MKALTLEKLEEMKPGIFAEGLMEILHPWFAGKKVKVKWVATRGDIEDWAIYHSLDFNLMSNSTDETHFLASSERIAKMGAKMQDKIEIRRAVPCNDEAFSKYRY